MAADLVASPTTTHALVHDLESAYWVLLWVTVGYMQADWGVLADGEHSSFLKETLSPRVFLGSGGQSKLFFLTSPLEFASMSGNLVYQEFLHGLKLILGIRHLDRPKPPSPSQFDAATAIAKIFDEPNLETKSFDKLNLETQSEGKKVKSPAECYDDRVCALNDHHLVLNFFKRALNSSGWLENDHAEPQQIVPSTDTQISMNSGTKRSRDVVEDTYLPPPPGKRSGILDFCLV